jgi:hypothetical protein
MKSEALTSVCTVAADEFMASVRITNLSDDATQNDLQELFRGFGRIARISVPRDRNTNQVQRIRCVALRFLQALFPDFFFGPVHLPIIFVLRSREASLSLTSTIGLTHSGQLTSYMDTVTTT